MLQLDDPMSFYAKRRDAIKRTPKDRDDRPNNSRNAING